MKLLNYSRMAFTAVVVIVLIADETAEPETGLD